MSVPHFAHEVISGHWAAKWLHGFFLSSSSFCSWNTRWPGVIVKNSYEILVENFVTLRMLTWWLAAYNFTAYFLLANMLEWDSCLLWNTNIDLNNWSKELFWWLVGLNVIIQVDPNVHSGRALGFHSSSFFGKSPLIFFPMDSTDVII